MKTFLFGLLAILAPFMLSSPVEASAPSHGQQVAVVWNGILTVDCALSKGARAAAICGGAHASTSSVTPNNQVDGNCGYSYIYIFSSSGPYNGYADFYFGVYSSLGTIWQGVANIYWVNTSTNYSTTENRVISTNSNEWDSSMTDFTNTGWVDTSMQGTVYLRDGVQCSIQGPSDRAQIY